MIFLLSAVTAVTAVSQSLPFSEEHFPSVKTLFPAPPPFIQSFRSWLFAHFRLTARGPVEGIFGRLKDGGAGFFRIFPSLFRVSAKKDFPRLPEGFFCVAFYDKRGIQLLLPDVLIEFCGPAEKFHDISAEAGPVCELLQLKGQGVEILRGSHNSYLKFITSIRNP